MEHRSSRGSLLRGTPLSTRGKIKSQRGIGRLQAYLYFLKGHFPNTSKPAILFAISLNVEGEMGKEKTEALELIRKLPDEVTTDAIMEELYFKRQVDKGLQDVAEGRVLSHQELKERLAQWRKSAGR